MRVPFSCGRSSSMTVAVFVAASLRGVSRSQARKSSGSRERG
jgi:hypothetical protein